MAYQFYMADEIQQFYYNRIKAKDSIENDVDNFWLNLLPDYFQKKLKFGIEQESRVLPKLSNQRADWTIRYVKNGDPKKVILMEDKRKGSETQSSAWKAGLEQLENYLRLARVENGQDDTRILYGAVNIGTYTRFYELHPGDQQCIDYPGTDGKYFEVAKDEAAVHGILTELVQKTRH